MKALLLAVVAAATLAPTVARAEFQAPRRPIDWKLAASKAKADKAAMKRQQLVAKAERENEGPVLSADSVMSKINTVYMTGLQRCYRKTLAADPSVTGKVTLLLSVDEKGRVLADVDGVTPSFNHCVDSMIGTWRFPHVSEPAEATFKISLMLRQ